MGKAAIEPRSAALEEDSLTTRPTRRSTLAKRVHEAVLLYLPIYQMVYMPAM